MNLIQKINKNLKDSPVESWANISRILGKNPKYGSSIKKMLANRITKCNAVLAIIGYELNIKKK